MQIKIGNLWDDTKAELILVTTNSYVNQRNELVMGRGAALEMKEKYPWIALYFGHAIQTTCKHMGEYNLILALEQYDVRRLLGAFQVKYHFKHSADLGLIERSVAKLNEFLTKSGIERVSMNYPGIGFGQLKESDVLPLIAKLPDKVTIYKKV